MFQMKCLQLKINGAQPTFSYRAVARSGRRDTAWDRGRQAASRQGAPGGRDADVACRTPAVTEACPVRHCPVASETGRGPVPCPASDLVLGRAPDPAPCLGPGPVLDLALAPTGSGLCISNRPSSASLPYSDLYPYACVYVCRDGEAVWS